jgi:hypothetical protein
LALLTTSTGKSSYFASAVYIARMPIGFGTVSYAAVFSPAKIDKLIISEDSNKSNIKLRIFFIIKTHYFQ